MIARIIVDQKSKMIDKPFDYLIPPELEDSISVGSRVIVPFSAGNKEIEGFCIGIRNESETKRLKSIIKIANDSNGFDEDMLPLIEWMHKKYLAPYLDIIHTIVPSGTVVKSKEWVVLENEASEEKSLVRQNIINILKDNGGSIEVDELCNICGTDVRDRLRDMIKKGTLKKTYRLSSKIKAKTIKCLKLAVDKETAEKNYKNIIRKAPMQSKMLKVLCSNEYISCADLVMITGGNYGTIRSLVEKGLAEYIELSDVRDPYRGRSFETTSKMVPTPQQKTAIEEITKSVNSGGGVYLLHGVTGSGKTEVFMQSIDYVISRGQTAIMLVPEISLTPQMVSRFMSRFGSRVAIIHSGLSLGERYDQWHRIADGEADIVIGARSAVFAPLKNIGIIIIDEEHSDTYKSEMSPRYNARDVAIFRGSEYGAAVVMASATPLVESYYYAKTGKYKLIEMDSRYNNNKMPDIHIIDMRSELMRGNRSMISSVLYNEIGRNLGRGEQTILFLNRRGFSTFVSCRSCGYVPKCPDCDISLTYHKFDDKLKCHYCGYEIPNYKICPVCGSKYIRYFGSGTQKVEDEIKRLFPNASTIRMDMDTTGKKQSHEKILQKFEKDKIDILIGTQMVAKGLDFENVTLVGVITADTMLNINDFRSGERTFAMLEQVSGRAGRGEKEGRAVIQTYSPDSQAVSLVKTHGYKDFYENEIAQRRLMWYPPFCKIIGIVFQGTEQSIVSEAARYFACEIENTKTMAQKIQILGPIPSYVSKIKNKYRWQIICKCEDDDILGEILSDIEMNFRNNKKFTQVSVVIDKSPNMIY